MKARRSPFRLVIAISRDVGRVLVCFSRPFAKGAPHVDDASIAIDVAVLEPEELGGSEPSRGGEDHHRPVHRPELRPQRPTVGPARLQLEHLALLDHRDLLDRRPDREITTASAPVDHLSHREGDRAPRDHAAADQRRLRSVQAPLDE
jgi:hypothetical protein